MHRYVLLQVAGVLDEKPRRSCPYMGAELQHLLAVDVYPSHAEKMFWDGSQAQITRDAVLYSSRSFSGQSLTVFTIYAIDFKQRCDEEQP